MSDSGYRVLWRETKRIRRVSVRFVYGDYNNLTSLSQLRRYESLPVAQLVPETRPLYVCQSCKFSNPLIVICPWCKHPCNTLFTESSVRKRVSAPQMLNERQKDQLQRMQARVDTVKPAALEHTVAAFDIAMPRIAPESASGSRRRRHRDAMAYTIALSFDSEEVRSCR